MHHFGDAPWRHKQLKQLSHLAHFVAGLFHRLFTNAGFRLVVVQQPGAGFNQHAVMIAIDPGGDTELTHQDHRLLMAVIQQHGGAIAAIVDLALVAHDAAVRPRQLIGHVA